MEALLLYFFPSPLALFINLILSTTFVKKNWNSMHNVCSRSPSFCRIYFVCCPCILAVLTWFLSCHHLSILLCPFFQEGKQISLSILISSFLPLDLYQTTSKSHVTTTVTEVKEHLNGCMLELKKIEMICHYSVTINCREMYENLE